MKSNNTIQRAHCDFSCSEKMCETLDRAGVPAEQKWRTLVLYMRGIQEYDYLSDDQKSRIQRLVLETLRTKDYSDANFKRILAKKQEILSEPCNKRLQSALQETVELVDEVTKLLLKRSGEVKSLGDETVSLIEEEIHDPGALIAKIKQSFQQVVEVMDQDTRQLTELSRTDGLTRIHNRRAFDEDLAEMVEGFLHSGHSLALILLDIDHFKDFNDTFGHRIGDQALVTVAKILREYGQRFEQKMEKPFIPCRYGGEEFAIIMPHSYQDEAMDVAEDLLAAIRAYNFIIRDASGQILRRGIRITTSAGVAEAQPEWSQHVPALLVEAADKALYRAKAEGRDRVCCPVDPID